MLVRLHLLMTNEALRLVCLACLPRLGGRTFFGETILWRNEDKSKMIFCISTHPFRNEHSLSERPFAERISLEHPLWTSLGVNISWLAERISLGGTNIPFETNIPWRNEYPFRNEYPCWNEYPFRNEYPVGTNKRFHSSFVSSSHSCCLFFCHFSIFI